MIGDMDLAPTERFSSRAEAYTRGRPEYPREMLTLLGRECGLTPEWRVADIGSGTGLLARLFLRFGCEVFGVEPNLEMRQAGERELQGEARFHSVDGRAEATGLPDGAFDLVTAGQAFHWFEPAGARAEFGRILRAPGWVVLAWNERRASPGFMEEHEELQSRLAREKAHPGAGEFDAFFGHGAWHMAAIPNPQMLDEETLLQRMESCSWAPRAGTDGYEEMVAELRRLFRVYAREGHVVMEYETRVYWGRVG
jgi:SAM-dependent methyltransferase